MIFRFQVEKVADLKHKAFAPDPNDPLNTVPTGQHVQELHLELVPDPLRGGRGSLMVQLNDPEAIGTFDPGDLVEVELRRKEGAA